MTKNQIQNKLKDLIESGDDRTLKILWATVKKYKLIDSNSQNQVATSHEQTLYRLVYTSARASNCDDRNIDLILEASRRNNRKLNITGVLLYTDTRFIQILEGPHEHILTLYEKILKDNRHVGSLRRFCEPVATRHFSDWNMAKKHLNSEELEYKSEISKENKKIYNSLMDGDLHSYEDDGIRVLKAFLSIS